MIRIGLALLTFTLTCWSQEQVSAKKFDLYSSASVALVQALSHIEANRAPICYHLGHFEQNWLVLKSLSSKKFFPFKNRLTVKKLDKLVKRSQEFCDHPSIEFFNSWRKRKLEKTLIRATAAFEKWPQQQGINLQESFVISDEKTELNSALLLLTNMTSTVDHKAFWRSNVCFNVGKLSVHVGLLNTAITKLEVFHQTEIAKGMDELKEEICFGLRTSTKLLKEIGRVKDHLELLKQ
jgi:hypothetical protein